MKVKNLTLCALCAALMALCAWISIPISEISITLQTFAVFFTLGLLGGKRGTLTVLVYILLGAVGLPVFTGFRATAALVGPTGGYIAGFLGSALLYWALTRAFGERPAVKIGAMVLGNLVCYALGTAWFYAAFASRGTPMGLGAILMMCVVPYIPFDLIKIFGAFALAQRLQKLLPGQL